MNYDKQEDGYKTIKTENVEYRIVLDRNTALWHIETDTGQTPVDLRGQYTAHRVAALDIKIYLDGAPARREVYKKKVA